MLWAIGILLGIGVLLVLIEVVIPGGVIGTIGLACIVAGIITAYIQDPLLGVAVTIGSVIFFGVAFWAWLKYLPKLPLAKQMFMSEKVPKWSGTDERNNDFLGKEGVTQTVLRPAGFAMIDAERVDVVTQGDMIQKDQRIKVIEVEGNRIVVAKVDDMETEESKSQ